MMAFDHVFLDVARNESRAIQMKLAGAPATLLFREFYCTDPGCDCRRVVLLVHWVEGKCIAASINYGFGPPRRGDDEPQIFLDPLNPQSEFSTVLLAVFTEIVSSDGEYRARLQRHYAMWKAVVDDPSHPEHAKVRGDAHGDPSFRPAFPARKQRQPRGPRTGARKASPGSQSIELELVVAKAAAADGKLQQRFRRLLAKVDRLRQRLRAWKHGRPDIDRELAVYAARLQRQAALGREMLLVLDRAFKEHKLSIADRKTLAACIVSLAGELVAQGGDEEVKEIYNRYGQCDYDAEVAAEDAAGVEALKAMMASFGIELDDDEVTSFEDVQRKLDALDQEEEAAARERRARRKKSAKQVASEARRAEEERSANKAVQEVYRALAMALHPDREQDPAERERKAELMREVNVAYEAKDLLRLLELQLQLERVDADRVETIAEERVRHYNRILDEQSRQLARELEELERPFRMDMQLAPTARLAPATVIARLRDDLALVQRHIAALEHDLEVFRDPRGLKAWLKAHGQPGRRRRGRGGERGADLFG